MNELGGWLRSRWRGLSAALALAVMLGAFGAVAAPGVQSGGPDIGSLMMGTPDEFEIARGINGMYQERTLRHGISAYGGAYPALAYLAAQPALKALGYSEWRLALSLRWFSLVFGLVTLVAIFWLTFIVSRSWLAAVVAAGFVALSPEFMAWSVRIHPDTLLWFMLALGQGLLALAVHKESQRYLTAALVVLVVATMTKLVGLYLLPWVVLAQLYLDARQPRPWRRFLVHIGWGLVLFVFVAYVTTPTLLVDARGFVRDLRATLRDVGLGMMSSDPGWGWLGILFDPVLVGPTGAIIFIAAVLSFVRPVLAFIRNPKERWSDLRTPELMPLALLLFAGAYVAYLVVSIRNYSIRYAAPALPTIGVCVGMTAANAWGHIRQLDWLRQGPWWRRALPAALVLGGLALELPSKLSRTSTDLDTLALRAADPRLEVGEWLLAHAKPDTPIIYDYNVYVPLTFKRAQVTFGLLESQVVSHKPKYVVIYDLRRAHFVDPQAGKGDESNRAYHRERVRTLALLERDELRGLRKAKRFEEAKITIYEDRAPEEPCPEHCLH